MNQYKLFYSPYYYADIGEDHVFPIRKFELVRDILIKEKTLSFRQIVEPEIASDEDVRLVHTADYFDRLKIGKLTKREVRNLGLPWSESLVRRSLLAVSGTISAGRAALETGCSSNLAGGTHHAFPDRGEGFCVLNDVAVAIRVLQRDASASRFLIIDCDVHQGNGNAFIFGGESDVFTFSIHGEKNFPLRKEASDLDIGLEDGTGDEEFISILSEALERSIAHSPDLIFYLAGADPFKEDKLGRLDLSIDGLRKRDEVVLRLAKQERIPIVTVMSGGYAKDIDDTVEIHCNTIRAAVDVFEAN